MRLIYLLYNIPDHFQSAGGRMFSRQAGYKRRPASLLAAVLFFFFTCTLKPVAADAQQISLSVKDASVEQVLKLIKAQTSYTFVYKDGLFSKAGKVTVNISNGDIGRILDKVFEGKPFNYEVIDHVIALKQKPVWAVGPSVPNPAIAEQDSLVHGQVQNRSGFLLIGVTVTNSPKGSRKKILTSTETNGSFEINAQKGDKLIFTSVGYKDVEVKYTGQEMVKVIMQEDSVFLDGVIVVNRDITRKKIPWTDTIDMTHRTHLNLGQLLQGSIPGLTLQNAKESEQVVSGARGSSGQLSMEKLYDNYILYADVVWRPMGINSFEDYLTYFKNLSNQPSGSPIDITYSTSVTNKLVPQLRGVSDYNGNTSGMLIVIDGFPQDGFPADYPMTNVESVKVVKDPEELAKWGPKAAGGLILITSKRPSLGKLQVSYSANYYYSPAPKFNRSNLLLASAADKLDYMRDANDSGFTVFKTPGDVNFALGLNSAEYLLSQLQGGSISQDEFNRKWDSLGRIDNESQLNQLQQNSFNQNQLITLSGGRKAWRFRATGNYNTSREMSLGNYSRTTGLIVNNDFLLFNNKLRAQWQINLSDNNSKAGFNFDPISTGLQPYQLLTDPQGRYIYDYSGFNPVLNTFLTSYGYKNFGENMLEDARLNNALSKKFSTGSIFNMDWELLPGLKWSANFQYTSESSNTQILESAASSATRKLINSYASPVFSTGNMSDSSEFFTRIDFHVPDGDIYRKQSFTSKTFNLRTALIFERDFGPHHIAATLGGGGFSNTFRSPMSSSIYGYDGQKDKVQQGLHLPFPDPNAGVTNYMSIYPPYSLGTWPGGGDASNFPYILLRNAPGDTTISRGLNWNGSFKYAYDNKYLISGRYNSVLTPNYGYDPVYTSFVTYGGELTWRISERSFLHVPKWISNIALSTGVDGAKIPDLPTQISAARTLQPAWNNYGIWVNNYNPTQQSGQHAYNIYQKLTLGMNEDRYLFDVSYNRLHIDSNNVESTTDKSKNFIGANARIKLRKGQLYMAGGYGYSLDGERQTNIRAVYDIARESYFKSPSISTLIADFTLQNISAYQSLSLMAATNAPEAGGGFSMALNSNFGLLPPRTKNLEAHAGIGFLKDRYMLDARYYRKTTGGLNSFIPLPTDPSTGLRSQVTYSEIVNKGVELYLRMKVVEGAHFNYMITLNGAYNRNIANKVPVTPFSLSNSYTMAFRNGYGTQNLWSYRWAGLDAQGNPQIYDAQGQKTANPDSATLASALVYSGVTRAPYTGGFIQEFSFNSFFARASILLNLGGVMRQYIPISSRNPDNSSLIADRWRKPGDEAFTDVAAISTLGDGTVRAFLIRNSSNSVLPADNIRLQEVQLGWQASPKLLQNFFIRQLTVSLQAQNLLVWKRNKLKLDPETVTTGGQIGLPVAKQYSLSVNMTF